VVEGHAATFELVPEQLEALAELTARRTVEFLRSPARSVDAQSAQVDAATVARELGVSRQFVYEHARELGGRRLPTGGAKPPWRFDLEVARTASDRLASDKSHGSDASDGAKSVPAGQRKRRRLPNGMPQPGSVLTVRPRGER
jgi:hypothetical protein